MNQGLGIVTPNQLTEVPVVNKQQSIKRLVVVLLQMVLALPLGLGLSQLHIGSIAWLFGGIVSGVTVLQAIQFLYNYSLKPNRTARKVGMTLVGLNVGFSIAHSHLTDVASYIPVFAFLTFFLLLSGTLIGYIYSRLSKTNLLTAMLATVPGGVGPMSSIAADYGKNVSLVSFVQALRVTTVVLLIPLVARVLSGTYIQPPPIFLNIALPNFEPFYLGLLLLALLAGALGAYLAVSCKIPAGDFFGGLIAGIGFNLIINDIHFTLPPVVNLVGQILLGITIGEYWGEKPSFKPATIGYALICIVMTLVTGAIAAMFAVHLTSWDWLTCLLVTAPGGSAEMILVALALNHNVEIVAAGHLVRLTAINSSLPIWLFLFRRFDHEPNFTSELEINR